MNRLLVSLPPRYEEAERIERMLASGDVGWKKSEANKQSVASP